MLDSTFAFNSLAVAIALLCVSHASAEPYVLPLWPGAPPESRGSADADTPTITVDRAEGQGTHVPAVVICPGGGYHALMLTYEGHDIAKWLLQHGMAAIVLKYRLQPYPTSVSIMDGRRAIRVTRAHAKEWGIDPKRIGMIGFSAGGHLASSVGTGFDAGDPKADDPIEHVSCRPDFLVLVYPSTEIGGGTPTDQLVTRSTPPAFLVHARTDQVVPAAQSERFYAALKKYHVPAEFLELPSGAHGLGCGKGELWALWQEKCVEWLKARKLAK
jgi:acetyl esterase/lipase